MIKGAYQEGLSSQYDGSSFQNFYTRDKFWQNLQKLVSYFVTRKLLSRIEALFSKKHYYCALKARYKTFLKFKLLEECCSTKSALSENKQWKERITMNMPTTQSNVDSSTPYTNYCLVWQNRRNGYIYLAAMSSPSNANAYKWQSNIIIVIWNLKKMRASSRW